jgi:hypothetical protein
MMAIQIKFLERIGKFRIYCRNTASKIRGIDKIIKNNKKIISFLQEIIKNV